MTYRRAGNSSISKDDTSSNTSLSSSSGRASPSPNSTQDHEEEYRGQGDLKRVAGLIKSGKAKNIILLLGAGISTSAGIPDFRSPETGLYHNLQKLNLPFPEAVFELGFFKKRPEPFWTLAKEIYPGKHYPTPTHYFLPLLHTHTILKRVFTQNIDTLESLAGLPEDLIVEAHGSFAKSHCLTCKRLVDRDEVLKAGVRDGQVVRCDSKSEVKGKGGVGKGGEGICGGLVKPDIVFFGENLPERFFECLPDLKKCDLLIVIGTSLQVQPFASLVDRVPSDCPRLLINREPVGPFSRISTSRSRNNKSQSGGVEKRDMYWEGDADEGIQHLIDELGWDAEFNTIAKKGKKELDDQYKQAEELERGQQGYSKEGKVDVDVKEKVKNGREALKNVVGGKKTEDTGEDDATKGLDEALKNQLKL